MRSLIGLPALALALSIGSLASAQDNRAAAALESAYFSQLDHWVGAGGVTEDLQNEVVAPCAKLVMLLANRVEQSAFLSDEPEEFHLRVDVCTKITVNRVRPQRELANPDVVALICDRGNDLYEKLCAGAGLR